MIKLNKLTDYAIVVLGFLSNKTPNSFSAKEISLNTGIPSSTVSKVCKLLSKSNLILSSRGQNGGYSCFENPININVAKIIESIDGPIAITACVDDSNEYCDTHSTCLLNGNWDRANKAVISALASVSLKDLLNPENFFSKP